MFSREEKKIIGLVSLVQFCLIVDFMIVMPQGPQLMRLLNISAQQFGFLISAYTFGAGALGLASAFFMDRIDRRKSLTLLFAGFGIGNLLCFFSSTYEFLLLARFVTGAFGGVVGSIIFAIVSDSIDIKRRASALGLVMSSFALASILGVPLCLWMANRWGWHAPFLCLASFTFPYCAVVFASLPKQDRHLTSQAGTVREILSEFKLLIGERSRALALIFVVFLILGHFSINPFLFPSIVTNAEIPETRLPIVYLVGGGASIIASVLFGKFSDRFGKKMVFAFCLLGSLVPIYFVTHLYPMGETAIVAIVTAFFVMTSGRLTPAMALITSTASAENRGSFMSLVGCVQQLSASLAAFLAGLLVTKTEAGKLLNFASVGFMAMAFSLVALFLSRGIVPLEGEDV